MKKKLTLLAVTLALITTATASGLNTELHLNQSSITPGENTTVGQLELTANNTDINQIQFSDNFRFNLSYSQLPVSEIQENSSYNVSITAQPPSDFPARTENGEITVTTDSDSSEEPLSLEVTELRNWTVLNHTHEENISVGSSGSLSTTTIQNTGNQELTVKINATGPISNYLNYNNQVTVYSGLEKNIVTGYDIRRDVEYGNYTGNLTLTANNKTETLSLDTELLDNIAPEVQEHDFSNFEATKPVEFTVTATDNQEVSSVSSNITYTEEVVEGNQTVIKTRQLEQLSFVGLANSNDWVATVDNADRPGNYTINTTVTDAAGNTANFSDSFTVDKLEALTTKSNVEFGEYRSETEVALEAAELEESTPLTVHLDDFNQDLSSSNWEVGIETSSGKTYFSENDRQIEISDTGTINVVVRGNTAGNFHGTLRYEHINQHVNVSNTEFNGEFSDAPVPRDQQFSVYNTTYSCDGHNNDNLSKSYWDCNFNISAADVPQDSTLQESTQTVIPRQEKQNTIQNWQERVENAQQAEKTAWNYVKFMLVLTVGSVTIMYYYIFSWGKHYSVRIKSTSRTGESQELINRVKEWAKNKVSGVR